VRETSVKELTKIEAKNLVLIEGLPGLGMVGRIAVNFLAKQLKANRIAELYSPHFPYYVLVNKKGNVRLLHGVFSLWKNNDGKEDIIFLTGDSQAQTIEGQYDVADCILRFAEKNKVKTIITIGGYRKEAEDTPKVIAVSTNPALLESALCAGAIASSAGNPIVGTAGLLLGMAKFEKIDALCLLGETRGYLPDPKAAKSILTVLLRILRIEVDLAELDKEIEKFEKIAERMTEIEARRETYTRKMRTLEERRVTYIS
jgi:uncharacterized protein (TIGR00162 family)